MEKKTLNNLFDKLFPILRSITGEGYRQSFEIFSKYFKFKKFKYPSGKKIFDWTVPKEWSIKDAYIKFNGKKIIDLKKNNLHVMNYSAPINKTMNLNKLNKYLYSIKSLPDVTTKFGTTVSCVMFPSGLVTVIRSSPVILIES